jgi:hypothetical protein
MVLMIVTGPKIRLVSPERNFLSHNTLSLLSRQAKNFFAALHEQGKSSNGQFSVILSS